VRVLHVHTRYREPGGEDSVVAEERRLLSESGFEVFPLDFQNPSDPVETVSSLVRSPWNASAAESALVAAREHDVDLVHIHNTWFALSPAVVPTLASGGFPTVVTFHNYRLVCVNATLFRDGAPCEDCVGRSPAPGVRHRCYRGSVMASAMSALTIQMHRWRKTWTDQISIAVTLTEFAKERLLQGGLPPDRTVVKPNFVSDPGPRPNPPSQSSRVLYVGRLAPEKGITELLDAWRTIDARGLELVVVGGGPLENELRAKASANVLVSGRMSPENVRLEMARARALVVPSKWYEGQPMVVLEALAAGLPVFHTDVGALAETSGSGGVPIGSGSPKEMSHGLSLLTDDRLVERVGRLSKGEYETRFSDARSIGSLRQIYRRAVGV
jgi:glycosyltransferase involved in cell wall biosynthesis